MGACLYVEITCIKPTAHIHPWNTFQWFVLCLGGRTHTITIKKLNAGWCLQRIIQKRSSMPYTIGFIDLHVIHLDRKPNIKCWMPGIVIDAIYNGEGVGLLRAVLNKIKAGVFDFT